MSEPLKDKKLDNKPTSLIDLHHKLSKEFIDEDENIIKHRKRMKEIREKFEKKRLNGPSSKRIKTH